MTENKPLIVRRKLVKLGGSSVLVVPKEWLDQHNLGPGDALTMVANRDLKVLAPEGVATVYAQVSKIVAEDEAEEDDDG